ncbi:NeuD/PglB/VioB family sugar acetyltransferase [uncultured Desulfuromonas sp.]|uniref:NeuD/PglB/VioB family sugar acetyltransferase n=1 Tax=uncultured Desulfuromonas sp. TaxID=181013 RepID=UPI002AAABA08|nr:NeuD/PglB/VioB family sugar acetyltransferase [uncultured Desulfuromonas sp.]
MKKLVILGGSGIGMIAASIANDLGHYEVLGFLNDFYNTGHLIGKYKKYPVLGATNDLAKLLDDRNVLFFVAYVGLKNEKETFEKVESLEIPQDRFATLIHPTAIIPKGLCSIGNGVLMAPLTQLSPDTTIGDNCILLPNSFVGHDSSLEKFAHIATNSVIGANVRVGRAVHVGSNATIREKVDIGDFSLIGAGSVVLNDVPMNSVVVGNPGSILETREL